MGLVREIVMSANDNDDVVSTRANELINSPWWPRIRDALLAAKKMERAYLEEKDMLPHSEDFHTAYYGVEDE